MLSLRTIMRLNWFLSKHIPREKYLFLLLMLRLPGIGICWVMIRVVWMVLSLGMWNPMTWGGIHLLQAGEPGQMETASVNWIHITTICICWWVLISLDFKVDWSCMDELLSNMHLNILLGADESLCFSILIHEFIHVPQVFRWSYSLSIS